MKPSNANRGFLDKLILDHLLDAQVSTATKLHVVVAKEQRQVSLQSIYKHLGKMLDEGILDKDKSRYFIRFSWLFDQQQKLKRSSEFWLEQFRKGEISRIEKGAIRSQCHSLADLHRLWTAYALACISLSPGSDYFEYVPHPWFMLAPGATEDQFIESWVHLGVKYHMAIGAKNPLDCEYLAMRRTVPGVAKTVKDNTDPFKDHYLSIVGEYTIKITVDAGTAEHIDQLFEKYHSLAEVPANERRGLFNRAADIRLEVLHDATHAGKLQAALAKLLRG